METGVLSPPPDSSQFATQAIPPLAQPASSSAIQPGAVFASRYRIECLLGQGGMGAVYKARDVELDRTVALKLVRPELASSPQTMARFKQELLLASKISHKNILRIYDLGDADGIKFITMALVEGTDLAMLIARTGRLPVDRALNFTRQLCAALDAAHSEGVVHRDLKPQNILIDAADHLYVSDFGLAKSLEPDATSMTRTGQLLGTPRYMSPEQVEATSVDHRSDLYSLGLILFEIFTADVPFLGESALQIMFQRVTSTAKDPRTVRPDLPDYLANIILKCLEKDPAARYKSAREILADLDAHIAPQVSAPTQARTASPRRRRPAPFSWLAATVVLAIAVLFVFPKTRYLILRRPAAANQSGQAAIERYMAILPFRVAGDEQNSHYIADGIVESLTAKLSGLRDVYVAPSSAVNSAMKQKDTQKIAHALGVKLLLQGTLTTGADNRIAIHVALDDVANGSRSLLAEDFTGRREDLLTVEDQIFNRLLTAIEIRQSSEEQARTAARPTQNIAAYEYYMKGRDVWRESKNVKDLERAIGLFNQAIQVDPRFALAYAGLADAERRMWDKTNDGSWTQKALNAAQQARALNDNLPEVHFNLGSLYTDTGRTAEAIAELQRALQLAPNSDEVLRRLGTAYLKASQQKEAIAAYTKATELNPYLWTNYNSLGNAYFLLGENDHSLAAYKHITELEPSRAEGWEGVGAVYFRMGRWSECISSFQKAIDLQPTATFYSNLGTAYYFLGQFDLAAATFEKAVSLAPDDDNIRVNLADAYRWSGQTAKASATYDQAIALAYKSMQVNPKDSETLGNLALCYAKKGDGKRALDFIARARTIDPNDNSLMYEQATIYTLAGRTGEAMASLVEALRAGYSVQEARSDPELRKLHDIPQFARLGNQISEERSK
ncbi:MAG TPA: tetratricopeptide repeat protein [Bryobacteraceae bacterium]|nr:tetratricopeptide repeat protein [Bryobacteraceae bacterium]